MRTKSPVQARTQQAEYQFEFLEHRTIKDRFDSGGPARLRRLADDLRCDADALARFAEAIDAGESYHIGPSQVCTWWGWG